ncbi:hypothetical protein STA3757_42930 [Stanieria sp. NIES-3757]|nr:hypothetical protein STA3757_42930 [Stanieria sp. NIES-3757]
MVVSSLNLQESEFICLSLAINKLFDKQEKDWGYFRIKKEEDFYSLYLPYLPSLKLYQKPNYQIYKLYWRSYVPELNDKSEKPDIYVRKKSKNVYDKKNPKIAKKQRIYEIMYQYANYTEINLINKIITELIREKIIASLSEIPENEMTPLVLIAQDV